MSIFCVTGTETICAVDIKAALRDKGHSISGSVTDDVDQLVVLSNPIQKKVTKAGLLGVPMMDEQGAIDFLNGRVKLTEKESEFIDSKPIKLEEVTVQVPLSELKRWAQLAGDAINPTVIFVKDDYEGMMDTAMDKADESIKELNESIHGVLDGNQ